LADPEIRPFRPEDAESAVVLFRLLVPQDIQTAAAIRHFVDSQPPRAQMRAWTADLDGEVVAWANARLQWALAVDDVAGGWVGVMPAHRGSGLGSKLYELAEDHARSLAARTLSSFVRKEDAEGRAFARRLGFREGSQDQCWELDVRKAVLQNTVSPPGVQLVPLREAIDREHELFELFDAAHSDMPGEHGYSLEFDEWLPEALGDPTLDLDLSAVALVDGRLASFAWIKSDRDGGVGANEMTGTHPDFRRRGLARLVKETTIRWAADAGIHTLLTSNDTTNADMLTLNEHLGYRPTHVILDLKKDL
jgi:GNAT superfamily N-acetyltransferase